MKKILTILCIICILTPIIVYGVAIIKTVRMNVNCINYFEMAADANSVEIAEKHLTAGINYLETNNITQGSTGIIFHKPTNNIDFWYENLKSAQEQLIEMNQKDNLTDLEESNALMKLRETLLDSDGCVTHPSMISFVPGHTSWFWWMIFMWLLWVLAIPFGVIAYEEY